MKQNRVVRAMVCAAVISASQFGWALAPDVELDRCLLATEKFVSAKDYSHAEIYLQKIAALKIDPPAEYDFYVGVVRMQQRENLTARNALDRYLQRAGKTGRYYTQALEYLTELEQREQAPLPSAVSHDGTPADATPVEPSTAIENPDVAYEEKVRQRYSQGDTAAALIARINELLASHVFVASKIKNPHTQDAELFSLSLAKKNEIVVTQQSRKHKDGQLLSHIKVERLEVFGVNPYVEYVCDRVFDSCWIRHPANGSQWIVLENDEAIAAEISKALTRLIKALQR
ncbi:MAG TPA: hypothetical protein VFM46_06000, partial [Pseudomonadales bacterium]|nr:hypothetical protein [Pseudomonadales bacterium]